MPSMFETVAGEGAQLKRQQLEREIAALPNENDRSNLSHTMSKLFMFLEDDLRTSFRMSADNPYLVK